MGKYKKNTIKTYFYGAKTELFIKKVNKYFYL